MGKFITKLYKYDSTQGANQYRGIDYSRYILLGDSDTDNLDDTLDTAELTLAGLPFREEFAPTTKFILEKWQQETDDNNQTVEILYKSLHLVVSTDAVEQPIISDDTYFNHCITFIEAGVEAQNRLVDNIAVTYKLQDVNLESEPTYDEEALATRSAQNVELFPDENFGADAGLYDWQTRRMGHAFKWVMPNWYQVSIGGELVTPDWSYWDNFKKYQEIPSGSSTKHIELPVPMLECLSSVAGTKTFTHNGYCSIEVMVEETVVSTMTTSTILTMQVNPNATDSNESWTPDSMLPSLTNYGWIESRPYASVYNAPIGTQAPGVNGQIRHRVTQVAEPSVDTLNRVIEFNAQPGCSYQISIRRKELNPGELPSGFNTGFANYNDGYDSQPAYYGYSRYTSYFVWLDVDNQDSKINANFPLITFGFSAVLQGANYNVYLRNAPPANAYDLFNKAQLTTQNFMKVDGTPVDETPKPFYLEDNDKNELKNTQIIENFYNQKNLWEVFMDIGKYIHARPQARFGQDNKFVINWKRYGKTDQNTDNANTINVFNSRFVEEYISSVSSYVTNMVQLGGTITETIAPKSSSEDYLVYNDVAELIVEKNIIEIVDVDVIRKSDGEIRNLTGHGEHGESTNGYIFEESVYNLLSINANDSVNKGLALYYTLGTNKIVGLNYQLPSINTGSADTDYAFKRILGTVYQVTQTSWKNIKINDYLFRITYRTKDTLRTDQSRPDLRKYLLSTPYDRVPQHNQFNNQTDIVVDSVKFGNNIYGKLIRTGNAVYTKLEWVDDLSTLKKSGDLYRIGDELYYVSKVTNTYYEDHIESEVEFSKDFNRLSQIIGIPSEPRFYEISERSLMDRECAIDDYIELGVHDTTMPVRMGEDSFIDNSGWYQIASWLINPGLPSQNYPNYAITVFKNDVNKETITGNDQFIVETCHPVNVYTIQNTLTIEWDMQDNFSAGDQVGETNQSITPTSADDTAYYTLKPYRYGDVYGRCDMVDFALTYMQFPFEFDPTQYNPLVIDELRKESVNKVQNLPESPLNLSAIGQRYIGTIESDTEPTQAELDAFFEQEMGSGETKQSGDYIYYKNIKYTYAIGETSPSITSGWRSEGTSAYFTSTKSIDQYASHSHGLVALKDCRETLKFNYNLQLLTTSDRFVLSSSVWQIDKGEQKIGLLKTEINKLANATLKDDDFAVMNIPYTTSADSSGGVVYPYRVVNIYNALSSYAQSNGMTLAELMEGVQAIVLYSTLKINDYTESGAHKFVFGRNITDLTLEEATKDWAIRHIDKNTFNKQ